ncbi:MAG: bifunctional oligoribonuclease/PAP phosphatase NrnA [FCB group bacterium]|nr:bifunctional oligoribonuclease/PAP phosphatase NrnA [FCB group bacterium]
MKSKLIQKDNFIVNGANPPVLEINNILDNSQSVLVVSHIDPDGDALGTQLAFAAYLKYLNKNVYLIRDDIVPEKYKFLHGINNIPHISTLPETISIDAAVILECPNIQRVGESHKYLNGDIQIINIDHHRDNELFGKVNWINIKASSVGEMVYEYFEDIDFKVDKYIAEQLYTAIMTDSGRFRFNTTSPRTMEIAGKLIAAGASPQKICDLLYYNFQLSTIRLIGKVLNTIEYHHKNRICFLTLTKEMLKNTNAHESESDGIVDYTLYNTGVKVGALLKEISIARTKVSLRSKDGINVSLIATHFGGGGHYNASGCIINQPLEKAKEELLRKLNEVIDEQGI